MNTHQIYNPVCHLRASRLLYSTEPCRPMACAGKRPYSSAIPNPTTSFHILNSALTYTFSAKERDTETSYSVTSLRSVSSSSLSQAQTSLAWHSLIRRFGSRYYSSDLSIWLSVDPKSDKYPSFSPYVYCANNPIKLVDPNGEEVVGTDGKAVSYSYDNKGNVVWSNNASDDTKRIGNAMLQTETGKEQLDFLIGSKTNTVLNKFPQKNILR